MLITLPLYILRELGKALGLALLIYSFVMLAFIAGQMMMSDGVSIATIVYLIPNLFPLVSPLVLPLTILTGTLICYGRLAGGNEFVAAQAGGVHPLWLASPALLVAALSAIITVFLNSNVLDSATASIDRAVWDDMTGILRSKLQKPGSIHMQERIICRLKSEGGKAGIDVTEFKSDNDGSVASEEKSWDPAYPYPVSRLIARDHHIRLDKEEGGNLFIVPKLTQWEQYEIRSNGEIKEGTAGSGNPRWPVTRDMDLRVSQGRLAYTGINSLLRRRRDISEKTDNLINCMLRVEEVKDWTRLATRIDNTDGMLGGTPGECVWSHLSPEINALVRRAALGGELSDGEKLSLTAAFNSALWNRNLFREGAFGSVALPPETAELLKRRGELGLDYDESVKLNRLLLEEACGESLNKFKASPELDLKRALRTAQRPEMREVVGSIIKENVRSYGKQTAELHQRLALSFACFVFALAAVPLGLRMRGRGATSGFGYGLVIAVAYFLLLKGMQTQVKAGVLEWQAIWLPNLFLMGAGAWLWLRAGRLD